MTDYQLKLSSMVENKIQMANGVLRDVPLASLPVLGESWSVEDLTKPGEKALAPTSLLSSKNLDVRTRNFYRVTNLPAFMDKGKVGSHVCDKVVHEARADAFDTLLAVGFTEQALGTAGTLLHKENASGEERQFAGECLLSAARALEDISGLVTKIWANSTIACREVALKGSNLHASKREQLRLAPLQSESILPQHKRLEHLQVQESEPVSNMAAAMCQAMDQQNKNKRRNASVSRGKAKKAKLDRIPAQSAPMTNPIPPSASRGRGGRTSRGSRGGRGGKGRGVFSSTKPQHSSK
jgi:hypothetical protein